MFLHHQLLKAAKPGSYTYAALPKENILLILHELQLGEEALFFSIRVKNSFEISV